MINKNMMIFGVGPLQKSLILKAKSLGLFVVGIDPDEHASSKQDVDAFEVVDGSDYDKTVSVAKRYNISGIITSATDKPLIMMARVAENLNLPFYSVKTAQYCTDKFLMKQKFQQAGIPCAKGFKLTNETDVESLGVKFPVIVKPRDNSGSRGVIYCNNLKSLREAKEESFNFTSKKSILVEEFIEGREFSIESFHYHGKIQIVQITEKITTEFPYNVELGHIQPADITPEQRVKIEYLIAAISKTLEFKNCASHTELKINSRGIYIIETSPRLGGDFITSTLVPLSTGISMEIVLINICMNIPLAFESFVPKFSLSSAILFFQLPEGIITDISHLNELNEIEGIYTWMFNLKRGDEISRITSSLNRYGYVILQKTNREMINYTIDKVKDLIFNNIKIKQR